MRERGWQDWKGTIHRTADVERLTKLGLGLMLIDALGPEGIAPFIYFQF